MILRIAIVLLMGVFAVATFLMAEAEDDQRRGR